jgi:hypothetical protein
MTRSIEMVERVGWSGYVIVISCLFSDVLMGWKENGRG